MRFIYLLLATFAALLFALIPTVKAEFVAGAAITDVTPTKFPVLINGYMTSRSADSVSTPVSARSVAFSDGKETVVMIVVDSCMITRELLDEAKKIASEKSKIPTDRILISATHTHFAPSAMGCLGTDADPDYVEFLRAKLVESVLTTVKDMKPAQIAWGSIDAPEYAALRRWVLHPKFIANDFFGNPTVRANMYVASDWDHVTGASGPKDPQLSVLSVQTTDGKPLAVYANYSMHYYGATPISADYFGLFSNAVQKALDPEGKGGVVAMMSQGCSGDIWCHDFEKEGTQGADIPTIEEYAEGMKTLALKAIEGASYERPQSIAMSETRIPMKYRVPDAQRLEWAKKIIEGMGDRLPKSREEVYAREQIFLDEKKETEVVVQGIRIGDKIGIATTPTETYALTGLKIKAASPLPHTMVVELANGGDGYIPSPEQHLLGGYTTSAARSAGLEVTAEPKITEAAIQMLEGVSKKPRVDRRPSLGPAGEKLLARNPRAYWRFDEFTGPRALDASANGFDATYEPHVVFYLPGPHSGAFAKGGSNHSAFLTGDRIAARVPKIGEGDYTVSLWFWSGSAKGIMDGTEWLFSRGANLSSAKTGDQVGLREDENGIRTLVYEGAGTPLKSDVAHPVERWHWHQLTVVRAGEELRLYLDGAPVGKTKLIKQSNSADTIFLGGSFAGGNNFEGRLDEAVVFDRALDDAEITAIYKEASSTSH